MLLDGGLFLVFGLGFGFGLGGIVCYLRVLCTCAGLLFLV